MSYDLFVGNPGTRIIRTRDVLAYFNAETDWENETGAYASPIDPRIAKFAAELAVDWPPYYPSGPLQNSAGEDDSRGTGYSFRPTSVSMDFRWSRSSEAYAKVRELALRHNLLFFNCSGRDWANGHRGEQGKPGRIYLVDDEAADGDNVAWDGETTWIDPGDADLLTEADWFKPDCHFGYEFGDQLYMQSCNSGQAYIIEYRQGSPDLHFQAETQSLDDIRQSFRLYYEGDDRAFRLLTYRKLRL